MALDGATAGVTMGAWVTMLVATGEEEPRGMLGLTVAVRENGAVGSYKRKHCFNTRVKKCRQLK